MSDKGTDSIWNKLHIQKIILWQIHVSETDYHTKWINSPRHDTSPEYFIPTLWGQKWPVIMSCQEAEYASKNRASVIKLFWVRISFSIVLKILRDCRGRDCMVVGFTITYAISAYHHWREFRSHSGEVYSILHYVIKLDSDLRSAGRWLTSVSSTNKTNSHNIVKSGIKHHNLNPNPPPKLLSFKDECICFYVRSLFNIGTI